MKISRNFKITSLSNSSTSIQRAFKTLYNNPHQLTSLDFGHLLQFFANHRLIRHGQQLHARLVLNNVAIDNFLGSKLINFYSRNDRLCNARKVFDEIPQRNTWSYNAMLIGYSSHDDEAETLRLFSAFVRGLNVGFKPDNFSITCVLKAYSSLYFDVDVGREVHCYALRNGYVSDLFVVNGLITHYARCEEMGLARRVFDLMEKRDVVSWNSMIAGYSQGGWFEECWRLYKLMLDEGELRPDVVTIANVLQACAQMKDVVRGVEVHKFVIESNVEVETLLWNALIAMYAKCGKLDFARKLFDEVSEKDEVTYGGLISGYLCYGYVEEAIGLFREMESRSLSTWNGLISGLEQNGFYESSVDLVRGMQEFGLKPNSVTMASLLSTLSRSSDLKGGKQVHAFAVRHCLDDNIYVTTGVIDVYGKAGFLQGAQCVFDRSRYRSVVVWTAIIAAYTAHGAADHALALFEDMLNQGIQPDAVTLTAVLTAYAQLGNVHKGQKILEEMLVKYGVQPTMEHYACVYRVLMQAGKLSEAEEFRAKMPIEQSLEASGIL